MKSKTLAAISMGFVAISLLLIMAFQQNSLIDASSRNATMAASSQLFASLALHEPNDPEDGIEKANLLFFEAERYGAETLLLWDATDELELVGYQVERSIGNEPFRRIGWVYSREISQELSYEFVDTNNATKEPCFYRLKMVDFDGREVYSPVINAPLIDY
jgi:hypothetical protein